MKRDEEIKTTHAIITIIELDLPELSVNLPSDLLMKKVNLNDDFLVKVNYNGDINDLFLFMAIIYKFDVVANK